MASDVEISNLALQKLGAARITSLTEDSRNARSCNACFEMLRDRELRSHVWGFAVRRAQIAADTAAPAFDFARQFTWPSDALRILPPNEPKLDWTMEGRKILTNDSAPLNVRYVSRVTDTGLFDALFVEALACKMAWHMCEEITQSNQKKADIVEEYKTAMRQARQVNAFEEASAELPEDDWVLARL